MFRNISIRWFFLLTLFLSFTHLATTPADASLPTTFNWGLSPGVGTNFGRSTDTGDFNNDGYQDALIGSSSFFHDANGSDFGGKVFAYYGSASGLASTEGWTATESASYNQFGASVATCDISGDGIDDIVVGDPKYATGSASRVGKVSVFYGSANGPSTTPDWTYIGSQNKASLGFTVSCAGDLLDNGYEGIVVGSPDYDSSYTDTGMLSVFYGRSTGLNTTPDWGYTGWTGNNYITGANIGLIPAVHGDLNGDGHDDIAIGIPKYFNCQGCSGYGTILIGSGNDTGISISYKSGTFSDNQVGKGVAIGNLNGDTYDDLLVTDCTALGCYTQRVQAYFGTTSGVSATSSWSVLGEASRDAFGESISIVGDTNGDDYNDVLIGATQFAHTSGKGKLYLYQGTSTVPNTTASWTYLQPYFQSNGAYGARHGGDFNNDGYADVLISVYSFRYSSDYRGAAWAFYGGLDLISGFSLTLPTEVHPDISNLYTLNVASGTQVTYACDYHISDQHVYTASKSANITFTVPVNVHCTATNSLNSVEYNTTFYLK